MRSVSCFRECTEAFLLEVCALLHVELVVPNSFIAQTGDVTTGIIILKRGEAHRRIKLVHSAGTGDAAAASQSAQHRKQRANSAEPHGPPATEPEGQPERPATSYLVDLSLASVKLDTSPRSSTVEARMDQFALPLSFTPMPPTARSSLDKEIEIEKEIELFGDRCPYSPGGTLAPPPHGRVRAAQHSARILGVVSSPCARAQNPWRMRWTECPMRPAVRVVRVVR